ncbi:MAG: PEP-CTERM sorting domain-containing protein [Nitrospira sp.]
MFRTESYVINNGQITVGKSGLYEHQNTSSFSQAGFTFNNGTFTNAGMTNINTGFLENNGDFRNNAGQVRIGEGALFGNNRDTPFSTAAAAGVYIQEAGGKTRIDGGFDNRGSVSNEGTITVGTTGAYTQSPSSSGLASTTRNAGTFQNEGRVSLSGPSSFFNTGRYVHRASGTTEIGGTFVNLSGHMSNAGTITVGTTGEYIQDRLPGAGPGVPSGTTTNSGIFTNAGSTFINAGTFINHGSIVNSGTFQVAALGQIAGNGSYVQNAAAARTIVNGTFAHNISLQAGSLSGTGIITGAVMNTGGVVQPGSSIVPGTLTLANYTQGPTGRLDLKIGGLLAGSQYDVLKITGPAAFSGNLSVRLINGFTPGLGNTFNLLSCSLGCSGLNGGTGLALPSLSSGLAWLSGLTDGGNGFSLTVVAAASAPEPGTLLLIGSGFVGLLMLRRRRHGSCASHK